MDERKLGELFRDAVPELPPPSFDHTSVAAESNRLRKRRKTALLGGSVVAVAVLVVIGVVGVAQWRGTTGTNSGAAVAGSSGNGSAGSNEVPNEDAQPSGGTSDRSFSAESPKQGGTPTGNAGPPGPGSTPSGCEKADPELAAALAGELRAAANSQQPARIGCPVTARGVALAVTDSDGHSGLVSLVVAPANAQFGNPLTDQPNGSVERAAITSDGRRVVVVSVPDPGSGQAPFGADLQRIVEKLAARI
jgi:hypothetical protein